MKDPFTVIGLSCLSAMLLVGLVAQQGQAQTRPNMPQPKPHVALPEEVEDQIASGPWQAEPLVTPPGELTARLGPARTIPVDLVGFNGNLTAISQFWDHPDLTQSIRQLNPGNLRYPAGTIGNYWDWETGWLDRHADRKRMMHWVQGMVQQNRKYTLENYAKGHKALGFTPVFMLNMVTKDLANQLEQLRRAKKLGLPVKYVELGNEYYFGIGAEPLGHVKYPTPKAYALACNEWAKAIKAAFPGVQIAAIGSGGGEARHSERRRKWNEQVQPHLSQDIDAMTLHPYAGVGLLDGGKRPWGSAEQQQQQAALLKHPAAVQHMMIVPYREWTSKGNRAPIDKRFDLWLTEFNVNDATGGVRHTWAQGLAMASMLSCFLDDPRVTLLCMHNPYGGVLFNAVHSRDGQTFSGLKLSTPAPEVQPLSLTPTGLAMSAFGHAANGRDRVQPIDFGDEAAAKVDGVEQPVPLVRGWRFARSDGRNGAAAVVVNLTPKQVTLDAGPLDLKGQPVLQWTASPASHIGSPTQLQQHNSKLGSSLVMPAYSITVIGSNARDQTAESDDSGH